MRIRTAFRWSFRGLLCTMAVGLTGLSACRKPADAPPVSMDSATAGTVVDPGGVGPEDSASLRAARDAAGALGQGLMKELLTRLASGGPDSALVFCTDSAQALTARYQLAGVDVHRTSLRVRNPSNAPDSAEVRVLEYLAGLKAAGTLPPEYVEVRRSGDGSRELRFFRPVTVAAGCLTCHGAAESIAPSIRRLLAERYPNDQATGYSEGDLRGAVAVRVAPPGR